MKCANCARDNPAGARYCVHCGAEQSLPTPIAAVAAAAMATRNRGSVPQAANAAHADPASEEHRDAPPRGGPSKALPSAGDAAKAPIGEGPGSARVAEVRVPAYASGPRRTGLALSLLIAVFVIAAGAFFAWRMLAPDMSVQSGVENGQRATIVPSSPPDGNATKPATPGSDVPVAAASSTTPDENARTANPPIASTDSTTAIPLGSANDDKSAEDKRSVVAPAPATQAGPVQITPLPAKPAARNARRPAPQREPEKRAAASPPPTAAPVVPATPAPLPPVVAAAAPKSKTAVADPWARMREELGTCTREDFITRVICDQRVRFRYCAGYWGKVPECPGNPTPDHGQ